MTSNVNFDAEGADIDVCNFDVEEPFITRII